jgi:hypothetical protein
MTSWRERIELRQQTFADQCALARTAHAGDDHEASQRKVHRDLLEIVHGGVAQREPLVVAAFVRTSAGFPDFDLSRSHERQLRKRRLSSRRKLLLRAQALPGDRFGMFQQAQPAFRSPRLARHARPRPGRDQSRDRRAASCLRRARRRRLNCRAREVSGAHRATVRCRARAGRWSVRPARRARR